MELQRIEVTQQKDMGRKFFYVRVLYYNEGESTTHRAHKATYKAYSMRDKKGVISFEDFYSGAIIRLNTEGMYQYNNGSIISYHKTKCKLGISY